MENQKELGTIKPQKVLWISACDLAMFSAIIFFFHSFAVGIALLGCYAFSTVYELRLLWKRLDDTGNWMVYFTIPITLFLLAVTEFILLLVYEKLT